MSNNFTSTSTEAPLLESLGLVFRQFWKLDLNDLQVGKAAHPVPSMSGPEKSSWTVIRASCGMILTFSSFSSICSLLSANSAQFSSRPLTIPERNKTDYCYFLWVIWSHLPKIVTWQQKDSTPMSVTWRNENFSPLFVISLRATL